jgi:serine/threonine protein phosphatase PrpC
MTEFLNNSSECKEIIEEIIVKIEEEEVEKSLFSSIDLRNICSKQDYIVSGKIEKDHHTINYIIGFDGHGTNSCLNCLKGLSKEDFDLYVDKLSTVKEIFEYVENYRKIKKIDMSNSGATCYVMKMCINKITKKGLVIVEHCGDSEIHVFKNNVKIFTSEFHDGFNETEMKRIIKKNAVIKDNEITEGGSFRVVDSEHLEFNKSIYINFINGQFAMTQSLGHNGITGCEPEYWEYEFDLKDYIRIVGFSDGVGDILNHEKDGNIIASSIISAHEIASFAEIRWKKEWIQKLKVLDKKTKQPIKDENGEFVYISKKIQFPKNGWDDISCGVLEWK